MSLRRILLNASILIFGFSVGVIADAALKFANDLVSRNRSSEFRLSAMRPNEIADTNLIAPSVATGLPSIDSVEPSKLALEDDNTALIPEGSFYLGNKSVPKAFVDISELQIVTWDWEKGLGSTAIPPKGFLKTGKEFTFNRIAVTSRQITFQTETLDRVSYRFLGTFTPSGQRRAPVTGKLIKIKNGKWVAEMTADFYEAQCSQ
ncbi:MAG: hypothetical protein HOP17_03870 [Acidobacteria bacterium]|nr:hypothetical protein [Acidobacteriota bacterium]